MTLESLKLYYYDTGTSSYVQVGSIKTFPTISKKMDGYSVCSLTLSDYEGALFSTWFSRDNTYMKIVDASDNILFQGYLKNKKFNAKELILTIWGFASKLDETEFNHNFILASGLVKTVPYPLYNPPESVSNLSIPIGMCFDGTYFYIVATSEEKVYVYDKYFTPVTSHAIAATDTPQGICWDGTYFYVTSQGDSKIYKYSSAFVLDSSVALTEGETVEGICWDGTYFYIIDINTEYVFVYDEDLIYTDVSHDIGATNHPYDIDWDGTYFYILSNVDKKVYVYDESFSLQTSWSISGDNPQGLCHAELYIYVCDRTNEVVYIYLAEDGSAYTDNIYIELKQDDEDAGYPDFTWADDYWINNQNTGLLIQDNTQGVQLFTWDNDSLTPHDHDGASGSSSDIASNNDGLYYLLDDYGLTCNAYVDVDVIAGGGETISETYQLKKIAISYNFGAALYQVILPPNSELTIYLQIKKGTSWINIAQSYIKMPGYYNWSGPNMVSKGITDDPHEITSDLSDYFDTSGGNYIGLKGIRFQMVGTGSSIYNIGRLMIDYLNVKIYYSTDTISPIMSQISDNGASWLLCPDQDFSSNGVQAGDNFQIGASTTHVLNQISSDMLLFGLQLNSTLSQYMARRFKGNNCMEGLQAVCQQEGLHWSEDHANGVIIVAKEADFEDSTISLTSADYDPDWEYEDDVNHYRGVHVYGNASLGIEYIVEDPESTSFRYKQIKEDTIMTVPDAKKVGDAEWAELQDKRPSIKISLTDVDGSYSALEAMKTINVTFERPTIAAANYVIRRLDIVRVGENLKYTIYCGFGLTPPEEKLTNLLRKINDKVDNQYNTRLVNTPLGAGANLTPDDIAGLDTYILSLLSSNAAVSLAWDTTDSASYLFTHANLTIDSAWHELDLDGYITVPTGTTGAVIRVLFRDGVVGKGIAMRATSQSNAIQKNEALTQVANVYKDALFIVPLDADNKFDYVVDTGMDEVFTTLLWWIKVVE